MPELAFELGTEELPSGACESALEQLRVAVESKLREARLAAASVEAYGTPRRLIVLAKGIPERQPDEAREAKGPPKSVAFDAEGKPTGAAIGFAKKQGVPVDALEVVSTPQGEYAVARVLDKGRPAVEVIGDLLADAVKELYFPKMMRWGEGGMRFARPIRWILALLDNTIVLMEVAGAASGRKSRGHRFLSPAEFEVANAGELLSKLTAAHVMWDQGDRRHTIEVRANALAELAGGSIPWDESLLDENNWLVEWPTALMGSFDPAYLELPRPVLITAMKKHQRFFPVEDSNGNLLPKFIAIRSGGDRSLNLVREGNERVLAARFNDAQFFYSQDRETPLAVIGEKLGRILFQEKLGTVAEKRWRLELLAGALADALYWTADDKVLAVRAATLCKADLASSMVTELPALQGIIGREYALAAGEDSRVAEAIAEHYQPRSVSDSLPDSELGRMLAVADRMDTIVGYVGLGIMPTGSSDPFGLRRSAHAVVQILAEEERYPALLEIASSCNLAYGEVNKLELSQAALEADLGPLFEQRIAASLQDQGIRYDLADAALYGGAGYGLHVYAIVRRAHALQSLSNDSGFTTFATVARRVANILKGAGRGAASPDQEASNVDQQLLTEPSETRLFEDARKLAPEIGRQTAQHDYAAIYSTLQPLGPSVDRFFDDVEVMVDDPAIRNNRLAFLRFVDSLYRTLGDFTKVVIT